MKDKILVVVGSEKRSSFVMSLIPLDYEVVEASNLKAALNKMPEVDGVIACSFLANDSVFGNVGDGKTLYVKAKEQDKIAVLITEEEHGEIIKDEIFSIGDKGWRETAREAVDSLIKMLRAKRISNEEDELPFFKKRRTTPKKEHIKLLVK